ncbi:unnamed protein product [Fusarium equiseti]|uniref:CBM-cenC domain-containing protein n=1 Tax=Fusarium equiseti TaxID=61235 RepID=A0A8J2IUR3_FUSEQ|nr:unnamed protein product [Fusarium equiseti]
MGCQSILAAAVIAASLLGVDASPCKPATTAAVSVVQSGTSSSVVSEATSAVLVETSLTLSTEPTSDALTETTSTAEASYSSLLETSLTTLVETTSTTLVESTSTELMETTPTTDATTSTALIEETPTTLAASTTTTKAETCIETQVVINPGFDNSDDGFIWTHNGEVKQGWFNPSRPNNLELMLYANAQESVFSQTLRNIKAGEYKLSYRWRLSWAEGGWDGLGCRIKPQVGNTYLNSALASVPRDTFDYATETWSAVQDFNEVNLAFEVACNGEYESITLHFDDITLTSVCADDTKTPIA